MKRRSLCRYIPHLLAATIVLPLFADSQPVPLEITYKSIVPLAEDPLSSRPDLPPQAIYTFSLRNTSDKTITAWSLSCLQATSSGRGATMGASTDSFYLYELEQEDPSYRLTGSLTSEKRPIYPGGVLDMETVGEDRHGGAPYSAISCAVEAVVFADGTFSGDLVAVDAIFEGREAMAADARHAIQLIESMNESTSESALRSLEDEVQRGENYFLGTLQQADRLARSGQRIEQSPSLAELRDNLRVEVARIEKHLTKRSSEPSDQSTTRKYPTDDAPPSSQRQLKWLSAFRR